MATGSNKFVLKNTLYRETWWDTLVTRHEKHPLIQVHKIIHNKVTVTYQKIDLKTFHQLSHIAYFHVQAHYTGRDSSRLKSHFY